MRAVNPRVRAIVRALVKAGNTPLARGRATRTFAAAARPIKLEIGGVARRSGWVVTNVNALARNYLDATARWPLEDGSVSHVYADNVIEHLPLAAGRAMLAEAHRCLRPGGVIRLVTPDIRGHVEMYLAGTLDSAAGRHYRDLGLTVEHPVDLLRIPIGRFGHHEGYVYDFATLDAELQRAGFGPATRQPLGQSEYPELAGLDQRAHEDGAQIAVEAVR